MSAPVDERDWRSAAARRALLPIAVAAVGITLAIVSDGDLQIVGYGVIAVAATILIALVFLEVGYSEDRARAREEAARGRHER